MNVKKYMEEKYPKMTKEFKIIQKEQYETFLRKQYDYGPENISMNTQLKNDEEIKLSLTGLIVRMNDKINRLINLVIRRKVALNESISDSFLDLSVYGIIALLVNRKAWGK